jgi:glycosyltransferase involved in cell wall biosynthesis
VASIRAPERESGARAVAAAAARGDALTDHPHRSPVPPLGGTAARPLWSVMIPAYRAAATLAQTLQSVLVQDQGPAAMQIEVVDDCSPDEDPGPLVARIGQGRVGTFRQPRNLGVAANLTECIRRARGHLIHLLHSDDLAEPGFYERMQAAFAAEPAIGAAFCRNRFIDDHGHVLSVSRLEQPRAGILERASERLALEQRIMTPAIVVRRSVYEALGGFDRRLICAEDWEMWVRIASRYPVWYEPEPLASYRMHAESNTGRHAATGEDIRFTGLAIDLFAEHLAPELAARVVPQAKAAYARSALKAARVLLRRGDLPAARAQFREALRLVSSRKAMVAFGHLALAGSASVLRRRSGPAEGAG